MLHLAISTIPTLGDGHVVLRLAVAAVLGGAIGVERELRDREAGVRTHLLVSLGSALFTIVSAYGFHEFLTSGASVVRADPTRIAAQIVTGIGFLGAGAIIREGLSVRGLTTAATLWVVAAIGMACGAGWYWAAIVATLLKAGADPNASSSSGVSPLMAAARTGRVEAVKLLLAWMATSCPRPVSSRPMAWTMP